MVFRFISFIFFVFYFEDFPSLCAANSPLVFFLRIRFLQLISLLPAYNFLDATLQGPKLARYIVGIPVGEVILFCLVKGAETWRERWAVRNGLVLELDPTVDEEDWQHVERPSSAKEGMP